MSVIDRTDIAMVMEGDGVEFRTQDFGGQSVAWVRLPAGVDLRPALVGLPGDLCQVPHWGYMISGRLVMHYGDRDELHEAGHAFYFSPGHAPEALTDCEFFEVCPTTPMQEVLSHLTQVAPPA